MREAAVASAKIAVDSASRRRAGAGGAVAASIAATLRGIPAAFRLLCYPSRARVRGRFHAMANIRQQKKRIRTAGEERLENLRYRSTIKTLTKRLATAVEGGDTETA